MLGHRPSSPLVGALLALALAAIVLLPNLGGYALWNPDEGRHSEVAREVLEAHGWRGRVVPAFNGMPYHDKPILYYLAVSTSYALGGVDEGSARAVSALAATATVLAVYAAAATAWSVGAGVAAAGVLVTGIEFVALGRYGSLDMLLTCWITLGTLACWRWTERPASVGWLVAAAAAAALGTLTKGLVAPVLIGGATLGALALQRRLGMLRVRPLATAAVVYLVLAVPWHVAAWHVDPDYIRDFFLRHQIQRFAADTRHFHPKPFWFPTAITLAGFLPWTALLPAAFAGGLAATIRRAPLAMLAAVWVVVVVGFFSASSGKLGTYVLPAFPPLALLLGPYCWRVATEGPSSPTERRLLVGGVALIALVCVLTWPLLAAFARGRDGGAWRDVIPLAGLGIPLGAAALALAVRRPTSAPAAVGAAMVAIVVCFYTLAAPRVSDVVSDAPIAATIARHGGPEVPVVVYSAQTPSLVFYLRRPVRHVASADGMRRARERRPLVFLVTGTRHAAVVHQAGGFWLWQSTGKHLLFASQPPPTAAAGVVASAGAPRWAIM